MRHFSSSFLQIVMTCNSTSSTGKIATYAVNYVIPEQESNFNAFDVINVLSISTLTNDINFAYLLVLMLLITASHLSDIRGLGFNESFIPR